MDSKTNLNNSQNFIFVLTTTLIVLVFLVTGIANLIPLDHIAHDLPHLGYPPYFNKILGVWKILGALVIALPHFSRWKELAYTGMLLDLSSASISRIAIGDGPIKIILPLIIAVWVLVSWRLFVKKMNKLKLY